MQQSLEQLADRREACSGATGGLVEAHHCVPARVEGEVAAGNQHTQTPLGFLTVSGLGRFVAKHPDLGVDDAASRRGDGDDRLLQEGEDRP